ncbi:MULTISPECIES: hypothetical protein [Cyanophyceae]|nr:MULTISPECIES: hypothetical protein [Cyanophyceae]
MKNKANQPASRSAPNNSRDAPVSEEVMAIAPLASRLSKLVCEL